MITKPLLLRVLCHTCSQIYLVWKHQGRLSQHAPFHVKNWAFQTGEEFCYGAGNWCIHMAWHKKELYPTEIIRSCPVPLGWSLFFLVGCLSPTEPLFHVEKKCAANWSKVCSWVWHRGQSLFCPQTLCSPILSTENPYKWVFRKTTVVLWVLSSPPQPCQSLDPSLCCTLA